MPNLGTIIGLIGAGRAFTATPVYRNLMGGVAALAALVVITAMVSGALLIGLFYGVYVVFVSYGLESAPALIATLAIGVLTLVLLVVATLHYMRHAFDLSKAIGQAQFPLTHKVSGVANAFIDGILGRRHYY